MRAGRAGRTPWGGGTAREEVNPFLSLSLLLGLGWHFLCLTSKSASSPSTAHQALAQNCFPARGEGCLGGMSPCLQKYLPDSSCPALQEISPLPCSIISSLTHAGGALNRGKPCELIQKGVALVQQSWHKQIMCGGIFSVQQDLNAQVCCTSFHSQSLSKWSLCHMAFCTKFI